VNRCPSGYTENVTNKTCDPITDFSACFYFTEKRTDWDSTQTSIKLVSGAGDSEPLPVYRRGLYYDGDSYSTVTGLVLHHSFTLEFWVRIEGNGNIYSISRPDYSQTGSEDYFSIQAVDNAFEVHFRTAETTVALFRGDTKSTYVTAQWTNIAVCMQHTEGETTSLIAMYVNAETSDPFTATADSVMIDMPNYAHTVAAELNGLDTYGGFLTGMVFSICYYPGCSTESINHVAVTSECRPKECANCPEDIGDTVGAFCLIECAYDQYPDRDGF
jgi:hypothetical protein